MKNFQQRFSKIIDAGAAIDLPESCVERVQVLLAEIEHELSARELSQRALRIKSILYINKQLEIEYHSKLTVASKIKFHIAVAIDDLGGDSMTVDLGASQVLVNEECEALRALELRWRASRTIISAHAKFPGARIKLDRENPSTFLIAEANGHDYDIAVHIYSSFGEEADILSRETTGDVPFQKLLAKASDPDVRAYCIDPNRDSLHVEFK